MPALLVSVFGGGMKEAENDRKPAPFGAGFLLSYTPKRFG